MGTYKKDSYKAAAIYDPATGDKAQMNVMIAPDTKFYEPEIIPQAITNGEYQSGWKFRVDLASSDWDAYAQLRTFKNAYTGVRAVAAGAGVGTKNLQWYETVQIAELRVVPKSNRSEGDSHFIVSLIFEGGENAAIFTNVNLLHQANVNAVTVTGFVDSDTNGIADGFTNQASATLSFAAGVQTITGATAGMGIASNISFPIGIGNLKVSVEQITGRENKGALVLTSLNFAASSQGTTEVILETVFVGIASGSLSLSSTNFILNLLIKCRSSGGTDTSFEVTKPCLRTDGSSSYVAG